MALQNEQETGYATALPDDAASAGRDSDTKKAKKGAGLDPAWASSPYSEGKKDVTKNRYGSRQRRHSTPSDSSGSSLRAIKLHMLSTVPYELL